MKELNRSVLVITMHIVKLIISFIKTKNKLFNTSKTYKDTGKLKAKAQKN